MGGNKLILLIVIVLGVIGFVIYKGVVKVDPAGNVVVDQAAADSASAAANSATASGPVTATDLYNKGDAKFLTFSYGDAAEAYEAALKMDETHASAASATYRLGKCYEEMKKPKEALAQYQKALVKYPTDTQATNAKKRIELLGGQSN
jgi:tetratricopeptide (TPR) repeat protein